MGRATSRLFAQEGAKVALAARGQERLNETSSQIMTAGGISSVFPGNLSVKREADTIVKQVLERYGRIDIVYSAAGGNFDPKRNLDDVDETFWNDTVSNTINSLIFKTCIKDLSIN